MYIYIYTRIRFRVRADAVGGGSGLLRAELGAAWVEEQADGPVLYQNMLYCIII